MRRLVTYPLLLLPIWGCGKQVNEIPIASSQTADAAAAEFPDTSAKFEKLTTKHLPNAIRIHEKVISGGLPAGELAFEELKSLGVKTIISVDGAQPNLAIAGHYGMRYVHLPHGYDGIPQERTKQLAKAVRDLPSPIYIHCHHGKHRSPAAAAVACVGAGLIASSNALGILAIAGTSPKYRGLYESASKAEKFKESLLNALDVEFPTTVELSAIAEAMVAIEHSYGRLNKMAIHRWQRTSAISDLDPTHEALILREHFTELLRTDTVSKQPDRFEAMLRDGENAATELESALEDWIKSGRTSDVPAAIGTALERININCTSCHKEFRDVPLSEK